MLEKKQQIKKLTLVAMLICVAASCSDSKFSGTARVAPPVEATAAGEKLFHVDCIGDQSNSSLTTDFSGPINSTIRLEGEFCKLNATPGQGSDLSVIFVLDFSGSMRTNDPSPDSCGRLQAAQAIATRLEQKTPVGAQASLKFGMVGFDSVAAPKIQITTLAAFKAQLTAQNFCGFTTGGATNYADAFKQTQSFLSAAQGTKVVYFISDGMPTMGSSGIGGDPHGEGQSAAEALRSSIASLTLNAIFLGASTTDPLSDPSQDPKTYLEKITGSADRVRLVTNADQVADQITTFVDPVVPTLETTSALGQLVSGTGASKAVSVKSLIPSTTKPGIWQFVTEPFPLYATPGTVTNNVVTLSVKASDGSQKQSIVTIRFTPTN